jgi:hypothetical protein
MKRSIPNLVSIFRAWCCTTFSPIFQNRHFLPKQECIGAFHQKLQCFNYYILYAFNPQLKSLSSTPDVFLAAQLNNFEGRF